MSAEVLTKEKLTEVQLQKRLEVLRPYIYESPLRVLEAGRLDGNVMLGKFESQQASGSFKERGAFMALIAEQLRGNHSVVAASAGNHAAGVARAAQVLHMSAYIFVPEGTPQSKINMIRAQGTEPIVCGMQFEESRDLAQEFARESSTPYTDAFDNRQVIDGQSTVAIELIEQMKQRDEPLDYLFVPVGGGGLLAGTLEAVSVLSPNTIVIPVQFAGNDSLHQSLSETDRTKTPYPRSVTFPDRLDPLCEGTSVARIGQLPYEIIMNHRKHLGEILTITRAELGETLEYEDRVYDEMAGAMHGSAWTHFPETTGALAMAGARKFVRRSNIKNKTLVALVTGGNNDPERTAQAIEAYQQSKTQSIRFGTRVMHGLHLKTS